MDARERRDAIEQLLRNRTAPITGAELAARMAVSRQQIVQDVALLRSGGLAIFATPEGYLLPPASPHARARRVIAVRHTSVEAMKEELTTIVDLGGTVVDVVIEHAVYGEFRGSLMIHSRAGVETFLRRLSDSRSAPMSALTDGVHLHTIEAPSEEILNAIVAAMRGMGMLLEQ